MAGSNRLVWRRRVDGRFEDGMAQDMGRLRERDEVRCKNGAWGEAVGMARDACNRNG
jgi:hypothetical protein